MTKRELKSKLANCEYELKREKENAESLRLKLEKAKSEDSGIEKTLREEVESYKDIIDSLVTKKGIDECKYDIMVLFNRGRKPIIMYNGKKLDNDTKGDIITTISKDCRGVYSGNVVVSDKYSKDHTDYDLIFNLDDAKLHAIPDYSRGWPYLF